MATIPLPSPGWVLMRSEGDGAAEVHKVQDRGRIYFNLDTCRADALDATDRTAPDVRYSVHRISDELPDV